MATCYKPQGVSLSDLEAIILAPDEIEALRLTDFRGFYQEQAAEQMGVSRQTFGLILKRARKKTAEALITGKAICMENGPEARDFVPSSLRNGKRGCGRCRKARRGEACPKDDANVNPIQSNPESTEDDL